LKSNDRDVSFVRIPLFEISAKEFLTFAKSDFEDNDEKGLINALSNAKRAISNRMDEMIKLSCLQKIAWFCRFLWSIAVARPRVAAIAGATHSSL